MDPSAYACNVARRGRRWHSCHARCRRLSVAGPPWTADPSSHRASRAAPVAELVLEVQSCRHGSIFSATFPLESGTACHTRPRPLLRDYTRLPRSCPGACQSTGCVSRACTKSHEALRLMPAFAPDVGSVRTRVRRVFIQFARDTFVSPLPLVSPLAGAQRSPG